MLSEYRSGNDIVKFPRNIAPRSGANAPCLASKVWPLGIGLVGFGALPTLLAAWGHDALNHEIETGLVKTDRLLVWFVAVAITSILRSTDRLHADNWLIKSSAALAWLSTTHEASLRDGGLRPQWKANESATDASTL